MNEIKWPEYLKGNVINPEPVSSEKDLLHHNELLFILSVSIFALLFIQQFRWVFRSDTLPIFFTNVFDFDVLIWNHCSNYKGKMGRRSWETQQCFQDARTKRNGANVHLRQLRSTSACRWLMSNRAGLRRTCTFSRVLENDRTCAGQASLSLLLRSLWRPWSHWNNQKLILRLSVNIY